LNKLSNLTRLVVFQFNMVVTLPLAGTGYRGQLPLKWLRNKKYGTILQICVIVLRDDYNNIKRI
ncbi:MAG: hypothetical protein ACMV14_07440, partial [Prevotella sp.]